jgi:hypothetical protein
MTVAAESVRVRPRRNVLAFVRKHVLTAYALLAFT